MIYPLSLQSERGSSCAQLLLIHISGYGEVHTALKSMAQLPRSTESHTEATAVRGSETLNYPLPLLAFTHVISQCCVQSTIKKIQDLDNFLQRNAILTLFSNLHIFFNIYCNFLPYFYYYWIYITSENFLCFSANCISLYLSVSPHYLDLLQHTGFLQEFLITKTSSCLC